MLFTANAVLEIKYILHGPCCILIPEVGLPAQVPNTTTVGACTKT